MTWGNCSIVLLQFQCPSVLFSSTVLLLSISLVVEYWASGPIPIQLSHKNEQFPDLRFNWMCFYTWYLFWSMYFKHSDTLVSHILNTGFDLWQYFAFKKLTTKSLFSPKDPPLIILEGHANICDIPHSEPLSS